MMRTPGINDRVYVRCWIQPWKEHVRIVKEIDGLQVRLAVEVDGRETSHMEWEFIEDIRCVEDVDAGEGHSWG